MTIKCFTVTTIILISLRLIICQIDHNSLEPDEISEADMHPSFPPVSSRSLNGNPLETSSKYWYTSGQKTVKKITSRRINQNIAKNVILFLGDGMSIPTVAAARVYQGGEETQLSFDNFPYTALSKTYAVDRQVPDSSNTATAYLCGVKANYRTLGVGPEVRRFDCSGMNNPKYRAHSIAYYAQLKKMRTGLVTTARVTHASPAGVYAHSASRDWESDFNVKQNFENPRQCQDIATQLLESKTGENLNVVMGGGRAKFLPNEFKDEEGYNGERLDGVNLIEKWLSRKKKSAYVSNRHDLLNLRNVDNVLALFHPDHMEYNLDRNKTKKPSLAEMTKEAINILKRGQNGYFLFVEGAQIDMAHHYTKAQYSLDETVEFSKAVQAAVDLTSESDTLIVVTADHSHTMTFGGYGERGADIFGFGGEAYDNTKYTTLSYANGPGYRKDVNGRRYDVSKDPYRGKDYKFPSLAPLSSETHGGDDVAVYAKGPWAHLFTGVLEQNVIPHLMSYASCVGQGHTACKDGFAS